MADLIDRAVTRKAVRDVMAAMEWPPTDGDAQIDAVLDAIASLPAQGVRVKPLEWNKDGIGRVVARTIVGTYVASKTGWGRMSDRNETPSDDPKAAAQADYERRILAALEPAEAGGVEAPAEDATAKGETPGEMLDRLGMDGVKWAAEFRTTALRLGYSDMDEGWLIGWFCNAIMAGYDRAPAPAPVEALVKAAVAQERERCAKVADRFHAQAMEWVKSQDWLKGHTGQTDSSRIAAAIRGGAK